MKRAISGALTKPSTVKISGLSLRAVREEPAGREEGSGRTGSGKTLASEDAMGGR